MCLSKKDLMTNNDNTDLVLHRAFVVLLIRNNTHMSCNWVKKKGCRIVWADRRQQHKTTGSLILPPLRLLEFSKQEGLLPVFQKKIKKSLSPPPFPLILSNFVFPHFSNTFLLFIFVFSFLYFSPSLKTLFFSSSFLSSSSSSFFSWLWNFCYFYFVFRFFKNMLGG